MYFPSSLTLTLALALAHAWPMEGKQSWYLLLLCGSFKQQRHWEFPGGPVVRTRHFHCQVYVFNPWTGN